MTKNNDYKIDFINKNITTIENGAFGYCKNLKSITVSNSKYYSSTNGNLYSYDGLFAYASGKDDESIEITDNILSKAFILAPNLKEIKINASNVESDSIYYLDNIRAITIGSKVKTIDSNFYCGTMLEKLYINNSEIVDKIDIDFASKIYVFKGLKLSDKTLEKYELKEYNETYDIYEVK